MDLKVSTNSTNFCAQVKMAKKSTKVNEISKKLQELIKNSTNAELTAASASSSAMAEASLISKFPYVAASTAVLNSGLAGVMFVDARAVKKEIAGKDSLIKQANDKIAEQEAEIQEKDEMIAKQSQQIEELVEARKTNFWTKLFRTRLWSI